MRDASISDFMIKDNVFSGAFNFDGRRYSLDGVIACYGYKYYRTGGESMLLGVKAFMFDKM